MKRSAEVYSLRGRILIASYSQTKAGFNVVNDFVVSRTESVADAELGRLVVDALRASGKGVPTPSPKDYPTPQWRKVLELAGVTSEAQFEKFAKCIMVEMEEMGGPIQLFPLKTEIGHGSTDLPGQEIEVPETDYETLGRAVKQALAQAQ
jgi:hypothetical protein